jgi:hypothetical protein
MKTRALRVAAGLGSLLLPSEAAVAGFQGIEVDVKPNDFGVLTFNVLAAFSSPGLDRMNAVAGTVSAPMSIFIREGTVHQHPFGTDRPSSDVVVQAFPSLAYDSFVTIGVKSVGPPGAQPGDEMILTPGWPGFGSCSLYGDNHAWAVVPVAPQGDPFDPVHSYPGDGRILIGQFSTADGHGLSARFLLQMVSDGVPVLQDVTIEYDLAPPVTTTCGACGPGAHWIDCCAGGLDAPPAYSILYVDTNLDGNLDGLPDVTIQLAGSAEVHRSNPADDSESFPGTAPLDAHLDVIDVEILGMELVASSGGMTLNAGGALTPSRGTIVELVAADAIGSSSIDLFFALDLGEGPVLYNQAPLSLDAQVRCTPPATSHYFPVGGLNLYTSPVPGQGLHFATIIGRSWLRIGYPAAVPVSASAAAAAP